MGWIRSLVAEDRFQEAKSLLEARTGSFLGESPLKEPLQGLLVQSFRGTGRVGRPQSIAQAFKRNNEATRSEGTHTLPQTGLINMESWPIQIHNTFWKPTANRAKLSRNPHLVL